MDLHTCRGGTDDVAVAKEITDAGGHRQDASSCHGDYDEVPTHVTP